MSILEMKVPSPGESITEVEIAEWMVEDGDYVEKDQTIAEVDSDKATLELPAEEAGVITLKAEMGDVVAVGQVVCLIDTVASKPEGSKSPAKASEKSSTPSPGPVSTPSNQEKTYASGHPSVAAKKIIVENNIEVEHIDGTGKGGRITKQDILQLLASLPEEGNRKSEIRKLSMLRRKIASRLVTVKNETAMLTTFNEVDMKPIMDLRAKYKDAFKEKYGVGLGFMSFFTHACTIALKEFPTVNSMIDGDHMISYNFNDVGIAVSTEKGLMVPVLRNADEMNLLQIESKIKELAIKARDGKISIEEITGGTFTITNGGVFGSMLSTPIINPPQSAILGMHNIIQRPVAIDGKVEIRPIMYVALSYDHRIIDGKDSVGFLVKVKDVLENPEEIVFKGKDPKKILMNY
ncbi:2-oxoglutarate dehydrogenase complex dihydrolipoyllysine-residue succinyltransferase [Bacteroidota bacterium]|nr:2-oxoglutarate dehydrogenase complex dihydrolipoyllysine-residue succinyltransferase [Bacteroidota bacterium]